MTEKHETAVALCVDANFLPFALFLAWQIDRLTPLRDFDIVIASMEELDIPSRFDALGIVKLRLEPGTGLAGLPGGRLPETTYLRLFLAQALGERYRRILYLDSDIIFEGGDLGRLMASPFGPHPVAAVRNVRQFTEPNALIDDFRLAGMEAGPYFNTGVLLIDPERFNERDCLDRCFAAAVEHPDAIILHDQSMLNIALRGEIAEMSPVWNWGANLGLRLLEEDIAVRLRHFIGPTKPWNDPTGRLWYRWFDAYRRFFEAMLPEALPLLKPRPEPGFSPTGKIVSLTAAHVKYRKALSRYLNRFENEWDILT